MKNFEYRIAKLEEVMGVYKGKVTIFYSDETLKEQIEYHNKKNSEKLTLSEVKKWKKVQTGSNEAEWYLSPNWLIEDFLE